MSGNTITQSVMPSLGHRRRTTPRPVAVATAARQTLAQSRAARELGLKRGEFDLAVRLGRIRAVPDEGGGGCRVARAEIDRVMSESGFPDALRERVKAVGTSEGAALMGVSAARFTRFARLGFVVPVKFYLNRYRAVVWLYLAEELRQFAESKENASAVARPYSRGTARPAGRGPGPARPELARAARGLPAAADRGARGRVPRLLPRCSIPCRSRRSSLIRTSAPA